MSKDQKPKQEKTQTADDILSSLMDDLKNVDKEVSEKESFGNTLGLDSELLKNIAAPEEEDGAIQLEEGSVSSLLNPDNFDINLDNESSLEGITGDIFEVPAESKLSSLEQFNITPESHKAEPSLFDNISDAPEVAAIAAVPEKMSQQPPQPPPPVIAENGPSLFGSSEPLPAVADFAYLGDNEKTAATEVNSHLPPMEDYGNAEYGDGEKTVAVAGFSQRASEDYGDKVKVSVGQMRGNAFSSGYAAWGSSDSNLAHAENLRIAQEKILDLEKENEKLRSQNEELIAASEIVKERADLLTSQLHEFKADRDSLEQSFKNETGILKAQMMRKDAEIVKASMKIEELESRMKFDLKKIRVRERELENRLELIRAEKNALVKAKDEQILSVKRLQDQTQLEVESYRQKCVELNKVIDTNQESFKRTTRALRLAMANLELQEENKPALKKVD